MEDKEKILFTIFGIVAVIAIVGVIGIFNKPTYILVPLQDSGAEQPSSYDNQISGMATSNIATKEACLRYKKIYSGYAWFDDWQWFKVNCEAKYDLSEPATCKTGYTGEYRCDNDFLLKKWQNSRCEIVWRDPENCEYGCSDGKCKPERSICTEKFLDSYQCRGGDSYRLYQNTDCSTYYKKYSQCSSNGCDQKTGECKLNINVYDAGFLDEYKCSGNYLQQKYQYSNGVATFISVQYCNNGCSSNKCN